MFDSPLLMPSREVGPFVTILWHLHPLQLYFPWTLLISVLITFLFLCLIIGQRRTCRSLLSLSSLWVLGIELMLSGLAASTFTCRAGPPALLFLRQVSYSRPASKVTLGKDDLKLVLLPLLPGSWNYRPGQLSLPPLWLLSVVKAFINICSLSSLYLI